MARVANTLVKNGFPNQQVALPLERVRAAAVEKGVDLDEVLSGLRTRGIEHRIEEARLIFASLIPPNEMPSPALLEKIRALHEALGDVDPSELMALKGMNKFKMFMRIREIMKKIPPERMARAEELMRGLTEEEKAEMARFAERMGAAGA